MINPSRRLFLRSAAAIGSCSLLSSFSAFPALAADSTGYKALVCVFLRGGADCHDLLLPYDQASYDRYAQIRDALINSYAAGPSSRDRSNLTALDPDNAADFSGRSFALAPELSGINALFQAGDAAVMANVGPLVEPVDRDDVLSRAKPLPKRLFSHNDQQSTWSALAPEGAQFGWGGRFADFADAANANGNPVFTAMSTAGHDVFLSGQVIQPYQLGLNGPPQFAEIENPYLLGNAAESSQARALIREHFSGGRTMPTNLFQRDIATASSRALQANEAFKAASTSSTELTTTFPRSGLGNQLKAVAQALNLRDALQARRQIFLTSLGGFDTHSTQANSFPSRLVQLDAAVTAFHQALQEMSLAQDVILFTVSDFGRTLSINGDGTDHGWGSHQLVVGGAVNGKRIYGDVPPYDLEHDLDADQGRLIPTTSVEQFAGSLGRWFGLSDSELAVALPNLANFSAGPAAFV